MLDINFIKENKEKVKQGMLNKGEKTNSLVDEVIAKDEQWRELVQKVDAIRTESNAKAKQIGALMGQGKKEEAQSIIAETTKIKEDLKEFE
ncbi:MAG TPA: serine--tRNA ligase, partial [Balneola sp.]|nr:serine--tRNA ligase [Balneola sp.]